MKEGVPSVHSLLSLSISIFEASLSFLSFLSPFLPSLTHVFPHVLSHTVPSLETHTQTHRHTNTHKYIYICRNVHKCAFHFIFYPPLSFIPVLIGEREGEGVFFYSDTSQYSGSWVRNKKHGEGIFVSPLGLISGKLISIMINFCLLHWNCKTVLPKKLKL